MPNVVVILWLDKGFEYVDFDEISPKFHLIFIRLYTHLSTYFTHEGSEIGLVATTKKTVSDM